MNENRNLWRPTLRVALFLAIAAFPGLVRASDYVPVDLTASVNTESGRLAAELGVSPWYRGPQTTVEGIPFTLTSGNRDLVATPEGNAGTVAMTIPIAKSAGEAYLLLGATMPPQVPNLHAKLDPPLVRFDKLEQCTVEVRYEDGLEDQLFPVRVRNGRYEIAKGMAVYCIPRLRNVRIERIAIRLHVPHAQLVLAGLTLYGGSPKTELPVVSELPPEVRPRSVVARQPAVAVHTDRCTVTTAVMAVQFGVKSGLTLVSMDHQGLGNGPIQIADGSFFEVQTAGKTVRSEDFKVRRAQAAGNTIRMDLDARPDAPLAGEFLVTAASDGEMEMTLRVKNTSDRAILAAVRFPTFSRTALGSVADTWYFSGQNGGIINHVPICRSECYGMEYPIQVLGLFSPRLGSGLCLLVHDRKGCFKKYTLEKTSHGVNWGVEYPAQECQPGESLETAPTALLGHTGDWRVELAAYRHWVKTWYAPLTSRKDWLRDVYDYHQHCVRTTRPRPDINQTIREANLYDAKTNTYRIQEVARQEREFLGVQPYVHIFDAGYTYEDSQKYGYLGDYCNFDEIGGKAKLAAAIAQAQQAGIPMGFYINGCECDVGSLWAQKHLADSLIVNEKGKPQGFFPCLRYVCPEYIPWQDHLAAVCRRIATELKPMGIYLDERGYTIAKRRCWSRNHGHPVPSSLVWGEHEILRKIRQATPAETALITEFTPADINAPLLDATLSYSITRGDPVLSPHRIDLFRFVFPDFKVFQLTSYNRFSQGSWDILKFPFFNGEGYWFNQSIPDGFEPNAQQFLRKALRILTDHAETFRSENPEPLVPTCNPLVYANAFPTTKETVWTLFNADYRTYRGPVLELDRVDGVVYRDLWNGVDLKTEVRGNRTLVSLTIGPRYVGCVARLAGLKDSDRKSSP